MLVELLEEGLPAADERARRDVEGRAGPVRVDLVEELGQRRVVPRGREHGLHLFPRGVAEVEAQERADAERPQLRRAAAEEGPREPGPVAVP